MTDLDDKSMATPLGDLEDEASEPQSRTNVDDTPTAPPCRDPELRFAQAIAGQRYEDVPHVKRRFVVVPRVDCSHGLGASSAALALEW